MKVRTIDIDMFFTSVVTVDDDAKLRVWDPLKVSLYLQQHQRKSINDYSSYNDVRNDLSSSNDVRNNLSSLNDVVNDVTSFNVVPEVIVDLKDDEHHSCVFSNGGRWVSVSSLETKNVVIYELNFGVPKLTHLCRLTIRLNKLKTKNVVIVIVETWNVGVGLNIYFG